MNPHQPKLIAFYLPQFHPTPENDLWWGQGFTEWTNVGRATPMFDGHQQPRVPADLGYYDLRLPEAREAQAALAREHGIHGFCYYHYWFKGRRLLHRPFDDVLQSGRPDFPFCLCWANENWTRAWDGLDRQVLQLQEYNAEDDLAHIRWLATALRDPRCIRVQGKPLLLIYRAAKLPDAMQTVSIWREEARKLGVGDIYLCSVESRVGGLACPNPLSIGFDAAVEFQPDGFHFPKPLRRLDEYGGIFDYPAVVEAMLRKPAAPYPRFPCVTPGWDNSPRRRKNPTIITGSTPELFARWLRELLRRPAPVGGADNFVFINAWNEWGEGAYLEPDQRSGRGYLQAVRQVLAEHAGEASPRGDGDRIELNIEPAAQPGRHPAVSTVPDPGGLPTLSVCIPVYNGDRYLAESLRSVFAQEFQDFEVVVADDCSTDDSAALAARCTDPRLRVCRNEVRLGLVGNWNRCLELARGRYLALFHQDDLMQPQNLRRKVEWLDRHPDLGMVYSDVKVVEADLAVQREQWYNPTEPNEDTIFDGPEFFAKLITGENLVCCPSVIFRRECFAQLGGFDPRLPYTADWEMWLRIALHFGVGYLSEQLVHYRVHSGNETHRFKGLRELEQTFRAKLIALHRAPERVPNCDVLRQRVCRELEERVLRAVAQDQLPKAAVKEHLALGAEIHRAGGGEGGFDDACRWFLDALDRCGLHRTGEAAENGWSPEDEQRFAAAKEYEQSGQTHKARQIVEQMLATKPRSDCLWATFARLQTSAGQHAEADRSWSMAISCAPKSGLRLGQALAMRGLVRELLGRRAEAMEDLRRAAQLALAAHHPGLACEVDARMSSILCGGGVAASVNISGEQLNQYCQRSLLFQKLGLDAGRPGPICTREFDLLTTAWEHWLGSDSNRPSDLSVPLGLERVALSLGRHIADRATEKGDHVLAARISSLAARIEGQLSGNPEEAGRVSSSPAGESRVALVIPTFNRLDLTRQCLASLQQYQGTVAFAIVVVDNGSTDGTVEFLKDQERQGWLRAILNRENLGFAKACNLGVRQTRGEFILFLNNDTQVGPGWLDALVNTATADANVGAVGSKLLFPDGTVQHAGVAILDDRKLPDPLVARHIHYRSPGDAPEANQPRTYQALTAACLLVRRRAFEEAGGFDEAFWNGYEDVDLCFKLRERGWLLIYQPESRVTHFESQSGPERFAQVSANIQYLHARWHGNVEPDFIVEPSGMIVATGVGAIRPYVFQPPEAVPDGPLVSIIMLVHNQLEDTRLALDSLAAHTPLPHELIVVDNGSTDGTSAYLQAQLATRPTLKVIQNTSNLGFAAGNNQGLALARGACVLFLNNDTLVSAHWLEAMLAALQQHPDTGLVGPMSNHVAGPQLLSNVPYRNLEEVPAFARQWAAEHAGQRQEVNRLVGFCLLARRSVIERIGGFDPVFGTGNFEDDDLCLRARLAGFRLLVAQDVFIHHTGGQTFKGAKMDYREAMLKNWSKFKQKWHLPTDLPLEGGYPTLTRPPQGMSLCIPLPALESTHQTGADRRCWFDRAGCSKPKSPKSAMLPAVAMIGRLEAARAGMQRHDHAGAWETALASIRQRPFHPEAWLLLAEIALAAGDSVAARQCAAHAQQLAPGWKAPKQFLKANPRGNAKHDWLVLPEEVRSPQPAVRNRLSVCLIVKNEERFLAQCLKSVRDLAYQIVVVDTGSTDRTVEIAKEHGAELHSFTWGDDFSAARNAALEHATGDWVLVLDADEELPAASREALRKEMQAAKAMAYRLPIVDAGRDNEGCSYVPRLFRNAPGLFFAGRVHEHAFGSVEARRKPWGLENRLGTARLLHHGYTGEVTRDRDKVRRNLRLLELALAESPEDPNLVMNLGLELVRFGNLAGGLERYREAFRLASALPPAQVSPELRETLLTQFCTHLTAAGVPDELIRVLDSPLAKSSSLTASLHFALGLAHIQMGQFSEAAAQMRQCLAKRHQPGLTPANQEIHRGGPHHCLAQCLAKLQQNEAADEAFRAGLAEVPQSRPLRLDYARFLWEQGRPVDGIHLLHALVTERLDDVEAWRLGGEIALSRAEFLEFAADWTGEAIRHLSGDPQLIAQRAEVLMLRQEVLAAQDLWRRVSEQTAHPRHQAAWILCETLNAEAPGRAHAGPDEAQTSRAFVEWYRRLVDMGAASQVACLNSRRDRLRQVLPTASRVLDAVVAEVERASPVQPAAVLQQ